jgi:hypothetical protein
MARKRSKRDVIYALSLETGADVRTVERWLDGDPISPVTEWAMRKCSEQLNLTERIKALGSRALVE